MKPITLILAVAVGLMATSDMLHGSAMRHWRDGKAAIGMNLLVNATRINPFNFNARLDQIESLYAGYRQTRNLEYLREAVLIGRMLTEMYPGNAQGWAVYSSAAIFYATHGGDRWPVYPDQFALHAIELDPLSVTSLERAMFLFAVKRRDYETFKDLGIKRSRLTTERLTMRCELCGRPWLEHK